MSLAWFMPFYRYQYRRPIIDAGAVFKILPSEVRTWLKSNRCLQPTVYREAVRRLGFEGVFPTGASFDEIAGFIRERLP